MTLRPPRDVPPPYDQVVFDCDSTLSTIEGVEELSSRHKEELRRMTDRAMSGEVPLEAVYGLRLELVRPRREDVQAVGRRYVETLLPHARELAAALHSLGKCVRIVSGGLQPAVQALGLALGLGADEVHAVGIEFDADGRYAGFEHGSPLARSGGKLALLARLAQGPPRRATCLVGDGATDLEAAPAVERFVAFGGVARRESVFDAARASCDAPDLAALLPLLLAPAEIEGLRSDPVHGALVGAAEAWL